MGRRGRYKTGIYIPTGNKCQQTVFVKYRSSWELAMAKMLDSAEIVVRWEFEKYYIAYVYRGKKRRYLVDFNVWLNDGTKYLVEIKPSSLYKKAMLTQDMNYHKWQSAISFCNDHGFVFKVITELTIPVLRRAWSKTSS